MPCAPGCSKFDRIKFLRAPSGDKLRKLRHPRDQTATDISMARRGFFHTRVDVLAADWRAPEFLRKWSSRRTGAGRRGFIFLSFAYEAVPWTDGLDRWRIMSNEPVLARSAPGADVLFLV